MGARLGRTMALLPLALLLAGCAALFTPVTEATPVPTPEEGIDYPLVRIATAWETAPLVAELAEAFRAQRPGVAVEVVPADDSTLVRTVAAGRADVAFMAALDAEGLRAQSAPLRCECVARDAVAVVVGLASPVQRVSAEDLRDVYAGGHLDWSELGAGGGPPVLCVQTPGSIARRLFDPAVMGDAAVSSMARVLTDDATMLEAVAGDRLAVGYASYAAAMADGRVRAVALDGVLPTPARVEAGQYPMVYGLYMLSAPDAEDDAAAFRAYVTSSRGQRLIEGHYAAP